MLATLVEHAHHAAIRDTTRRGIGRVDLEQRLAFDRAQAPDIDEARIEKVARRRRDHRQGVLGRTAGRLVVGHMVGQAVLPFGRQALAVELALARRCRETALGKRRFGQRQRGEALRQQRVEVDPVAEGLPAQRVVLVGEAGLGEAHAARQFAEHPGVAARLAARRHGRAIEQHIGVTVAEMHVPVLELRGGGQQVVGVVGGVGLELLEHHRKQVFACEAGHYLTRIGRDRDRVAVVDDQRFDRIRGIEQGIADRAHVDGARPPAGQQVGPLQRGAIDREMTRAGQQQAARALAPGTHQRRQAGDGTRRIAAATHPLHAVVQADRGGLGGAVGLRQRDDLRFGYATHRGGARCRPLQRALAQLRPAQRVLRHVFVVDPVVHDQLVHQRQRQRRVGTRQQRNVLVALVRGFGLARVDAHQPRAGALGRLGVAPEMQIAGDRVAAPDQDQLRFGEEFDPHADLAAQSKT